MKPLPVKVAHLDCTAGCNELSAAAHVWAAYADDEAIVQEIPLEAETLALHVLFDQRRQQQAVARIVNVACIQPEIAQACGTQHTYIQTRTS